MTAKRATAAVGLSLLLSSCGDDAGGALDTDADASTRGTSSTGGEASTGTSSSGADTSSSTVAVDTSSGSEGTSTDTSGGAGSTGGTVAPSLPNPSGPCPQFEAGDLDFEPAGVGTRRARVYFDSRAGGGGPLVFWFHGTGRSPQTDQDAISTEDLEAIVAMGGMVVMPWNDPRTDQFPWWLVSTEREDDLLLMDEIVGCAAAGPGIDPLQIHAAGFSAGGLHTSQAAIRRASYLASTVVVSGGLLSEDVPTDAPQQAVNSMILYGGPSDDVAGFDFDAASELFRAVVEARDGYALMCNHGDGHTLVSEREYAWEFFQAHPFGTDPSPFEVDGTPGWTPAFCE